VEECWLDLVGYEQGQLASFCEHCNGRSDSLSAGNFLISTMNNIFSVQITFQTASYLVQNNDKCWLGDYVSPRPNILYKFPPPSSFNSDSGVWSLRRSVAVCNNSCLTTKRLPVTLLQCSSYANFGYIYFLVTLRTNSSNTSVSIVSVEENKRDNRNLIQQKTI
jgi:hypothetical protein